MRIDRAIDCVNGDRRDGLGVHDGVQVVERAQQRAQPVAERDAQQGERSAFGFINPLLYRLAGTRAFHDILPVTAAMPQQDRDAWEAASGGDGPAVDVFDSQKRAYTQQLTTKGYDTMTGVGTPNGAAFITALRRTAGCSP